MPYPEMIKEFLDKVLAVFKGKISIKTRIGRHVFSEIETLLPIFNQYPLANIIIHPRLGVQMYKGPVDLDAFACCMKLTDHKLVYNGDIKSVIDYKKISDRFRSRSICKTLPGFSVPEKTVSNSEKILF